MNLLDGQYKRMIRRSGKLARETNNSDVGYFESLHRRLRCFECRFADKKKLGERPCCNRVWTYSDRNPDGSCSVREEEKSGA